VKKEAAFRGLFTILLIKDSLDTHFLQFSNSRSLKLSLLLLLIYKNMKVRNIFIGSLVGAVSLAWFTSAMQEKTVVDIAMNSDIHTTLVTAVVEAELADTLSGDGPFTVFAPTNDAFAKLPEGTVEMLLEPENIEMLQSILTYHVLPARVMSGDLTQGLMATTVEGSEITLTHTNNTWYVNSAKIIATDLVADNGVVHVIDSVIMPPMSNADILDAIYTLRGNLSEDMEERVDMGIMKYATMTATLWEDEMMNMNNKLFIAIDKQIEKYSMNQEIADLLTLLKYEIKIWNLAVNDIVDVAVNSGVHETLVTALTEADLVSILQSDGPFTVFAPVDTAFVDLPEGTLDNLLAQESKADLKDILTYHVVPGAYMASDITDGLMLETVQGQSLEFTINDGVVSINGMPTLLMTDIATSNGIVHVIDDVLMPNE